MTYSVWLKYPLLLNGRESEVYVVSRPGLAVAGLSKLDLLKSVAVGHHVFGRRHLIFPLNIKHFVSKLY